MTDPLLFGLAVVGVLITPGPTNTLLVTSGASIGLRRSATLLLAEAAGYCVSVAIVMSVADSVFSILPVVRSMLGVIVGLYLIALAASLWRRGLAHDERVVLWRHVFITTMLNPKALVFGLMIIPRDTPNVVLYFASFMGIVPVVGAMWLSVGAMPRRWMDQLAYAVLPKVGAIAVACFALLVMGSSMQ